MANDPEIYIGLMSGTSLDSIDAALVSFTEANTINLVATHEHELPAMLRDELLNIINNPHSVDLDQFGKLHRELGLLYSSAVKALLTAAGKASKEIKAIGCHGQTVRHNPNAALPFTLQIGDAATLANECNIPVVADFRSADIALGGQGAPLVTAFHQWAFGRKASTVVNIGGIANLSALDATTVSGFDTGPGNVLMDYWCQQHTGKPYDQHGAWAASGQVHEQLLQSLLSDTYFSQAPPKSTGREHFNARWLNSALQALETAVEPADVQATLCELTAATIAIAVRQQGPTGQLWLCGGGAFNTELQRRISAHLPETAVSTTADLGLDPSWVEAVAFAWLARARLLKQPAGSPATTGARIAGLLGSIHQPAEA